MKLWSRPAILVLTSLQLASAINVAANSNCIKKFFK